MPKGYWIVHIDVSDPVLYQQYVNATAAAFAKYGARFLVRGGKYVVILLGCGKNKIENDDLRACGKHGHGGRHGGEGQLDLHRPRPCPRPPRFLVAFFNRMASQCAARSR